MGDLYNVGQKTVAINTGAFRGSFAVVNGVTGKKIKVLSYVLSATFNDSIQWRTGTTALSGLMSLSDGGGINAHYCPLGLFKTTASGNLNILLTLGDSIITGHLVYVLE